MGNNTINLQATQRQFVASIDVQKIHRLLGIRFPTSEVWLYLGVIKHVQRRHPGIIEKYYMDIPHMITTPDYIGNNPKEPFSIELYKYITDTLLLAIKLDPSGYLFISSLYDLNNSSVKIQKRLRSGRIVAFI